jgi:Lipase (class 3)
MLDLKEYNTNLNLCLGAYDSSYIPLGDIWSNAVRIRANGLLGRYWVLARNPDFGYVICCGSRLYVVFRGTDSLEDWIYDFKVAPNSEGIHRGFAEIYASLQSSMVDAIEHFGTGLRITCVGHSLGGAIATEASRCIPGSDSYTFAAPRIFTASIADKLDTSGVRIINERDIVPNQPGRKGVWNYKHKANAYRFVGNSIDIKTAHSLKLSYSLASEFEGPMLDLD